MLLSPRPQKKYFEMFLSFYCKDVYFHYGKQLGGLFVDFKFKYVIFILENFEF